MHTDCFHGMSDVLIHFMSPNPLLVKADVFRERTFLATVVHHQCNAVSSYIRGCLTITLYKKEKFVCLLFYPP